MIGTLTPSFASPSATYGIALAAASLLTVTRTSSDPARASAATCLTVDSTSAVSVLVIDWTTTGTLLPTRTPPMFTLGVLLRLGIAMRTTVILPAFRGCSRQMNASSRRRALALAEQQALDLSLQH